MTPNQLLEQQVSQRKFEFLRARKALPQLGNTRVVRSGLWRFSNLRSTDGLCERQAIKKAEMESNG